MPIGVAGAIGIGAGIASLIGTGVTAWQNSRAQKKQNERNAQAAREKALWDKAQIEAQNKYNDPSAQMARLRAAGLNANLIYGSSVSGATGNQSDVAKAETPEIGKYQMDNPGPAMANSILEFQNLQEKQARIDNTDEQTLLTKQKIANESMQYIIKTEQAKRMGIDNEILEETAEYQKDAARLGVEKQKEEIQGRIKENLIKDQELSNKQRQYEIQLNTKLLQEQELALRKHGITSSDNIFLRLAVRKWSQMAKWDWKNVIDLDLIMEDIDSWLPDPTPKEEQPWILNYK